MGFMRVGSRREPIQMADRLEFVAPIAQWIEHWFPKPGVACSSHAGSAMF